MAQDWSKPFYNSSKWIKCRNGYMQSQNYICERCGDIAEECHHQVYLTPANIDDPEITLNWDLLEALCMSCHSVEHGAKIIQEGLLFDENGNIKKKKRKKIPPIYESQE